MKKINKHLKSALCLTGVAVCGSVFAISPMGNTYASIDSTTSGYNMIFQATQVQNTVDASTEEFKIPLLKSSWQDSDNYTIQVKDPQGKTHSYTVGEAYTGDYFTLDGQNLKVNTLKNGDYTVTYIVHENNKDYYSKQYIVNVVLPDYTIDLTQVKDADGLNLIIPKRAKTGSSAIELPVGSILDAEDAVVAGKSAVIKISKDKSAAVVATSDTSDALYTQSGKTYFNPKESGTYTITYSFAEGKCSPISYTVVVTDDFVAPTASDISISTPTITNVVLGNDVTINKLTVSDNYDTDVEYNVVSITLRNSSTGVYQTLEDNQFTFTMTKENFKDEDGNTLTSYEDMEGNYELIYTIKDAYGNQKTLSPNPVIKGVKDTTKPQVYMAYDYTVGGEVVTGAEVALKTSFGYNEIYFPAIYATDKVASDSEIVLVRYFQKVGSSGTNNIYYIDNLDINGNALAYGDAGYNYALYEEDGGVKSAKTGNANESVRFQFAETEADGTNFAGNYKLYYKVITKTSGLTEKTNYVYEYGTTPYTFSVLAAETRTETSTPTISIDYTGVANPILAVTSTGVDNENSNSVKFDLDTEDEKDSRLKNAVYYYYTTETDADTILTTVKADLNTALTQLNVATGYGTTSIVERLAYATAFSSYNGFTRVDANGNEASYEFYLDNYNQAYGQNAVVIAITLNEYGKTDVAVKLLNLEVRDYTDSASPVASIFDSNDFENAGNVIAPEYEYNDTINLPDVNFIDATDKTLICDVRIVNANGKVVKTMSPNYTVTSTNTYTRVTGGTVKATTAGSYKVVYTAIDDAGNVTYMYFDFVVNAQNNPTLSISVSGKDYDDSTVSEVSGGMTLYVGGSVTIQPTIKQGDDNVTSSASIVYTIANNDHAYTTQEILGGKTYIFEEEGTYTITVKGTYLTKDTQTSTYTITVKKPSLAWDSDVADIINEFKTNLQNNPVDVDTQIQLPAISAHQGKEVATITYTVKKVTSTTSTDVVVDENDTFTTGSEAKAQYNITATATAEDGSTLTYTTFSFNVGDNTAPTISMDHVSDLEQEIVYDGTKLTYSIAITNAIDQADRKFVVTVKKGDETIYSYNTNLVIKDKDDKGIESVLGDWDDTSRLSVELSTTSGSLEDGSSDNEYYITSTGAYTLTIKVTDDYDNSTTKTISFNVVSETEVEETKENVVGIVLIIVASVVLVGAILFFLFAGKGIHLKKRGTKKAKKSVKTTSKPEDKESKVEEKEAEEVKIEKIEEEPKAEELVVEEPKVEQPVEEEPKPAEILVEEPTEAPIEKEEADEEVLIQDEPKVEENNDSTNAE